MTRREQLYKVRIEEFFEAAHNLRSYKGQPEPLHGHSWKVEVELCAPKLDAEGMAMDFIDLKTALQKMTKKLDYTYINDVPPFTDLAPSAENIARWIFEGVEPAVLAAGCKLLEVRVYEGRHASATYGISNQDR
jgi:6-pyruvoyltetrahydropterin/6-carboxytetrahydropterin synthase